MCGVKHGQTKRWEMSGGDRGEAFLIFFHIEMVLGMRAKQGACCCFATGIVPVFTCLGVEILLID